MSAVRHPSDAEGCVVYLQQNRLGTFHTISSRSEIHLDSQPRRLKNGLVLWGEIVDGRCSQRIWRPETPEELAEADRLLELCREDARTPDPHGDLDELLAALPEEPARLLREGRRSPAVMAYHFATGVEIDDAMTFIYTLADRLGLPED